MPKSKIITLTNHATGESQSFDDVGAALKHAGDKKLTHFRLTDPDGKTGHLVEGGKTIIDSGATADEPDED